ncbi:ATPase family AAA domain-containing protein 2B isoform X1 [Bufo gargarizans]|uniref:ATPase family AAA domain-containing protein 2B isoform X1 n=1 Tax=Bufo gargarizans TaxID=30331 RepID=UPI001CF143F6|nr:ATPase family AAA domain-containing protein 2B isoform X1 [Bufo gargarizans]
MVKTRRSALQGPDGRFISSRTRSGQSRLSGRTAPAKKEACSDASLSDSQLSPPAKRACNHAEPVRKESPKPRAAKQREGWSMSTRRSRLLSQSGATLPNSHSSLSLKSRRVEKEGNVDHSCINGGREVRRSCRSKSNRFESLNQSLLFDQLVNSTAEAVLQEMDNINIRRGSKSREVERLRMWTDTEFEESVLSSATDGCPPEGRKPTCVLFPGALPENMDMYSRVKGRRKSLRRNSYPIKTRHEESSEGEEEEEEEEEEEVSEESHEEGEDGDEEAEVEGEENDRPYNLRQRKTVERYQAPPIEPAHQKKRQSTLFDTHRSPARRSHIRRKKHAIHSSDTTSSSDEERFERRKSKSMAKARNRCLPMNLRPDDLASGILRERVKVGASLADVDPMNLDRSVRFDSVGGLSQHIYALKEMVVFPLLYPEIFEKFKIQPPRGCLFYGPPGTGKTLVARALANECSQGNRKVSFFMRKGADCLSKWVGESERQLRLLFDQAYVMRPSIIFFDEIDGLAPVRSSRQDQIHSSIVSTLLALMDGLDNRGEMIVIGATNRLDSIDPALRRPGRFDREFLFSLPDQKARKHILQIHTRDWNPKLSDAFLEELAEKCVGYCGADIKALCTEAALIALRRRYPQIYASSQKLQLDISSVVLGAHDFYHAMKNIVPASQRAVMSPGHALSLVIRPLLQRTFSDILCALHKVFPHAEFSRDHKKDDDASLLLEDSEDESPLSIFDVSSVSGSPKKQPAAPHKPFLHFTTSARHQPTSYRPRFLLCGPPGSGQTSHLAPAVLHILEKFSVHRLDLPALYSVSAKTPEESCAQVFREARRTVPSVVYMPHIGDWWEAVSETVRATFLTLLQDIPSFSPILLLSTSEIVYGELPLEVKCIFRAQYEEVFNISRPSEDDRLKFFQDLILNQAAMPPPKRRKAALQSLEVLPPAPSPPSNQLSEVEKQRMEDHEENTLRELRLFLRDVTKRLATDKRFNIFSKPVDIEEVSDYLEVIREPMDLSTIMTKIDKHHYMTVRDFLTDVDLICSNALEYNPDKEPGDKIIRHRACTLKDTAHAIFAAELDLEFNKLCEEIKEARTKRGLSVATEQINPQSLVARKAETGAEDVFRNKHRIALDMANHSTSKCPFPIRKKHRRRSQWGRGIIRKKKSTYLKKDDEDSKFRDDEDNEDPLENGDCLEENGDETGDHSVTNDESSCDIMDAEVDHQNGTLEKGSSFVSTEEDTSNESMLVNNDVALKERTVTCKDPPLAADYVNGCASMDSIESTPVSDIHNGNAKSGNLETTDKGSDSGAPHDELVNCCDAASAGQDAANQSNELEEEPDSVELLDVQRGEAEGTRPLTDQHLEEVLDPEPPLLVDHKRLESLLDKVVKKSDNLTVDELERWYSALSQCIYTHRTDYDKTSLIEEMERTVDKFLTFL